MTILLQNGNLFFSFCQFFFFFVKISFSYQKQTKQKNGKKKDFAAARLATISDTRWTGNKLFFKGGIKSVSCYNLQVHKIPNCDTWLEELYAVRQKLLILCPDLTIQMFVLFDSFLFVF